MKVAVYTIAKNEEQFVARWAESAVDADYRIILDTGSTDGTVALAEELGVDVGVRVFEQWRFDHARNAALELVPQDVDYCIALDMDEVLQPGWRAELEAALGQAWTRPRYRYVWSWERPGVPGLVYGGDKIHARHGYTWRHPVHEVITPTAPERQGWVGLEIHHHPDHSKSRGQYLPLLELAVAEDPDDDRNAHYLAREYFFAGRHEEAEAEFRRHLSLDRAVWAPERAASMRYLFKITGDPLWLLEAVRICPDRREAWVELAQFYYDRGMWEWVLKCATRALAVTERPLEYLTEAFAWGPLPHDLAAIGAYHCRYFAQAQFHGRQALKFDPYDPRLERNLRFYEAA